MREESSLREPFPGKGKKEKEMDAEQFIEMINDTRVVNWYGNIAFEVVDVVPDYVSQEIYMKVEAQVQYDLQKIIDYLFDNMSAVLVKDLPSEIQNGIFKYSSTVPGNLPVVYKGMRIYAASGDKKPWENVFLINRMKKERSDKYWRDWIKEGMEGNESEGDR